MSAQSAAGNILLAAGLYWVAMGFAMAFLLAAAGILVLIVMLIVALAGFFRNIAKARDDEDDSWLFDLLVVPGLGLIVALITALWANPDWQWINDHQTIGTSEHHNGLIWLMPVAFVLFIYCLFGSFFALNTPRLHARNVAWLRFSSYAGVLFYAFYFTVAAVLAAHSM